MLTKCANPQCTEEFYSLRHGRLFVLDVQPPPSRESAAGCASRQRERLEYFWLCDGCCKSMRVGIDRDHRVLVTSLKDLEAKPLEVLPSAHPLAQRTPVRGGRRLRHPSVSWREGAWVREMF